MNIKIAFTDIDGTLLNKERIPSAATIKQVNRLTEKSIPFILISSRMPSAMYHIQQVLGVSETPLICYNGGLVLVDGKSIHSTEIPVDIISTVAELNAQKGFHISLYNQDDWYVEERDYWAKREENNTKVSPQIKPIKETIADWQAAEKGAHKIMCMGDKAVLDKIMDVLGTQYQNQLHLYRSKDTYIEIASKEISKLTGIKKLLAHQYPLFSLEDCVAFGDNYNDIEMLEGVKIGVAVGNARTEVLAIADFTTSANHDDGVARWLEKWI